MSALPKEWVMVIPVVKICTSSAAVGRLWVLQLAAVSQSPPAGLVHVTVDGRRRASKGSNVGL